MRIGDHVLIAKINIPNTTMPLSTCWTIISIPFLMERLMKFIPIKNMLGRLITRLIKSSGNGERVEGSIILNHWFIPFASRRIHQPHITAHLVAYPMIINCPIPLVSRSAHSIYGAVGIDVPSPIHMETTSIAGM